MFPQNIDYLLSITYNITIHSELAGRWIKNKLLRRPAISFTPILETHIHVHIGIKKHWYEEVDQYTGVTVVLMRTKSEEATDATT